MWPNPQETADLVTFTKVILNEKLHFLCKNQKVGIPSFIRSIRGHTYPPIRKRYYTEQVNSIFFNSLTFSTKRTTCFHPAKALQRNPRDNIASWIRYANKPLQDESKMIYWWKVHFTLLLSLRQRHLSLS